MERPIVRAKWLRTDRLLGEYGIRRDNRQGRLEFANRMEQMQQQEREEADYGQIRRGWRFGGEEFVALILD